MNSVDHGNIGPYTYAELSAGDFNERLTPVFTPALGLQTYEQFESDKNSRGAGETALIAGDINKISYDYTKLFDEQGKPVSFADEKKSLEDILTLLRDPANEIAVDDEVADITFRTTLFRYKEIEFVETVQQLNRPDITPEEKIFYAEKYRRLNDALYSSPDPSIYERLRAEVWTSIDTKIADDDVDAARIKSELEHGFDARGQRMSGLERGRRGIERLSKEAIEWIRERIFEEFGQYYEICQRYWEEVVVPRAKAAGVEPEFNGEELYELFSLALSELDPDKTSGISVRKKPNSSNLAWNTPTLTVDVGMAKRAVPVDSPQKAFAKVFHELLGHGGRTINGFLSKIPMTGFGIFSQFEEDGNPDYLSIEEGILTLIESIICDELDDNSSSQWGPENVRYYLAISAAELEGQMPDEIYETTWRYGLLMDLKPGEKVTPDKIEKAKVTAARSIVRYKRSLPAEMPVGYESMTWHKDLAYSHGRIKAIPLLESIYKRRDNESFSNLFKTHTDPTNPYQNRIAALAGFPVRYKVNV
ncbi:MAG: hypothetical protein WAU02_03450 [Candidatus Saccharimonadales bacterium]